MGVNWTKFTEWLNAGSEPSSTLKNEGFKGGYKPPAAVFNYLFNRLGICIGEIQAEIDNIHDSEQTFDVATTSKDGLMSATDKAKLNGIKQGAEVNQNSFSNIAVGSTTISADAKQDTLTLVAGSNVTLTPDETNDTVTISATDTVYANATQSVRGLLSANDKKKLDGIASGAEVNQNAFGNVKVGSTTISAADETDAFELVAGDNVTITPDATNKKVTIKATVPSGGATSLSDLGVTASASELNVLDGITATTTELNYVDGVTSNIQSQLNGKASSSHSHSGYASSSHTHSEYADKNHTHSGYASSSHSHSEYMAKSNPTFTGKLSNGGTVGTGSVSLVSNDNVASHAYSAAIGSGLKTTAGDQVVVGAYNDTGTSKIGPFIVGNGLGNSDRQNALRVGPDNTCYGAASFKGSGADYAMCLEWLDGNPSAEDRRGLFVALDGKKIKLASPDDERIIGVISANPAFVENTQSENWQGKYLKDIFGAPIKETVIIPETIDEETIPEYTQVRLKLNPDYDPSREYESREERQEWDMVGTHGILVAVDDGTCEVNGYCTVGQNGVGTKSEKKTRYIVMDRIDDTHIELYLDFC